MDITSPLVIASHLHSVLAIDPGGTTGVAYRLVNRELGTTSLTTMAIPLDETDHLWALVGKTVKWQTMLCERFTGEGHMNAIRVSTIELVGSIRALCWMNGIPFVYRSAQERRAFQDDAKTWHKGQGVPFVDHQEDALAHLLRWEHDKRKESQWKVLEQPV